MECVSECPTHILDRVRSLSVQVKASKCELKCWKATIDGLEGGKTILFYLYRSPAKLRGPMRGLKDGSVARKPVQHFLMSVVRLKTLFWEIERRKTSLDHLHTARNRSDFNIRHLGN
ncbi:hypothetical protein TNIN_51901 [Trichonephila inaurata madagascariensis]|uniref:Uncharacterized protein n=1 Tax=Trichonephila inaurata madagascariensis TaxID=2747483 RepID=A0A8X7C632_9ARAC|nr:hypothetical protein TNIN_51901 [Trichonephila inaurata madagascariensis]